MIVAHRGWSGRYTENTLSAIRAALELGVDFVEIDVHETRDGELVVFHDYRLRRLCGVRGRLRDKTLAELKEINPDIPTLDEALRICRRRARVLVEIKRADPWKVAAVIERCKMTREVIVFSLSVRRMKQFAAANSEIARFGLVARRMRSWLSAFRSPLSVQGIGLSRRLVKSHRVVDRIHRKGWKLFVWTVNRPAEMKRLVSWGIDGLITNHPDVAQSCLARR